MTLKAYKYRVYPNKAQTELLLKHFGCVRFIYNYMLDKKIKAYKTEDKRLSCFELIKSLPELKKEFEWLEEVNAQSLQMSIRNLDNAFTKFFREKKGFPNFKKKTNTQSFQCPQKVKIDFENNKISIPKIKSIRSKLHRRFEGIIKTCTISKNCANQYFISVLIDDKKELPKKAKLDKQRAVGIDVGIKSFCVMSNSEVIDNPKHLKPNLKQIAKLQKRVSRKLKGGKNRQKAILKLARKHNKIANVRDDFLHKLSKKIVNDFDVICIEDLNIKGMTKNHCLAQAISDCSWGKFFYMLNYKCDWYGKNLIKIGRFDPSSKICNNCGYINKTLKLSEREWVCPECKSVLLRDENASKNILDFAFQKQNLINTTSKVG